jgi:hypothetical protein
MRTKVHAFILFIFVVTVWAMTAEASERICRKLEQVKFCQPEPPPPDGGGGGGCACEYCKQGPLGTTTFAAVECTGHESSGGGEGGTEGPCNAWACTTMQAPCWAGGGTGFRRMACAGETHADCPTVHPDLGPNWTLCDGTDGHATSCEGGRTCHDPGECPQPCDYRN